MKKMTQLLLNYYSTPSYYILNYLRENPDFNEKEEICALKRYARSNRKFLRNDVVSKQNLIDSSLEHNSNLLNHQCCRVIQDTQSNVRSVMNTDVIDNHSNNHGVKVLCYLQSEKTTTCTGLQA